MTSTFFTRLGAAIALAIPLCMGTSLAQAQTKPTRTSFGAPPASILWVGNSFFYYNNSMHGHFSQLVASSKASVRGSSVTISGSGLDWHDMESLLRAGGIGRYSFVGENEIRFNAPGRQFDAAMMMDCSQCPVHPQLQKIFYEYAGKHSATARKYGAAPILFMSWAYQDKPEMTAQLAAEYVKAGKQNNALVVPAGLAFAASVAKRPDLNLYVADKRHPSLAGTYLAACTVLASVYKTSPVGLKYTAGLPADVATHLQNVAWETAQAFHAKEGRGGL